MAELGAERVRRLRYLNGSGTGCTPQTLERSRTQFLTPSRTQDGVPAQTGLSLQRTQRRLRQALPQHWSCLGPLVLVAE
jgi:hypothetical protein